MVDDDEVRAALVPLGEQAAGARVVVLVPDGTRTAPMARLAPLVEAALSRAASVTFLVALGTHQPMGEAALAAHLGPLASPVVQHAWWDNEAFAPAGSLSAGEVAALTGGRLDRPVEVRLNRLVTEADLVVVLGPVFPHEVVGFSGGNKYLVPGVAGQEIIDATHWLGALWTSRALIGTRETPVRALVDRAAGLVAATRVGCCFVVEPGTTALAGFFVGPVEAAFAEAAALSATAHIRLLDRPVPRVLSILPDRYDDLWTGAKGMYKVEPVVADGGEVILFAPRITEFSRTHGRLLAEIGYHVRDYFLGQWDRYSHYPGGVLAHSTHLKGDGSWSAEGGEQPRITVTLATGIDEERCRAHNLGYLDPAAVEREAGHCLVVEDAGEVLYRLSSARTSAASEASCG